MKLDLLKYKDYVYGTIAVLIFALVPCTSSGQVLNKRDLQADDFPLWGTLVSESISNKGNWVSYYMKYESGKDTLFVCNTHLNTKHSFPGGWSGKFHGEKYYTCNTPDNTLAIQNLITGEIQIITNTQNAQFSENGEYLITIENTIDGGSLILRNSKGTVIKTIGTVKKYKWNNAKNAIAYTKRDDITNSVFILQLSATIRQVKVIVGKLNFSELTWSSNDFSLAFYGESSFDKVHENMLYSFNLKKGRLDSIACLDEDFPKSMIISPDRLRPLRISLDGKKIFFGLRNKLKIPYEGKESDVEIWNANARILYPTQHYLDTMGYNYQIGVWWPKRQKIKQATNDNDTYAMLVGEENYILTANENKYPLEYKRQENADFFLTNLDTRESIKLLEYQTGSTAQLRTTPNGMYIIYYSHSDWWSYCLATKKHINLTKGLKVCWDKTEIDPNNIFETYGIAGCTNTNELIIYDHYDLWLISMDGIHQKILTNGRETNKQYRIVPTEKWKSNLNFSGSYIPDVDQSSDIVISIYDFANCIYGYTYYNTKNGLIKEYFNDSSIDHILKAPDANVITYIEQKYDTPPRIVKSNNTLLPQIIFQSNQQHDKFFWGNSKIISYSNSEGDTLKGALFYPPHYDKRHKYPMIVYIYESLSQQVNEYVNPSISNPHGLNITNLLTKGYVVLLPDIIYGNRSTGQAAVDCVTSAVQAVLKCDSIDSTRIGLQGHSFGGFETNFIITHTDIFAAAVSGSAVSDVVSGYLSIRPNADEIDIWRYENYIYRMGGSLYEHTDNYLANSPVLHVAKITTPILLFAGRLDDNVKHEQSIEFYIALRRMKKQAILLMYPSEGHIMTNPTNSLDITKRVEAWFDYFLKGDKNIQWISRGVN
jgi:dipeptidyl aminopeptidase/acylaminoacyl peptidase